MNSNHRTHAPKETDSFRNEYNKTSIEKNDTMIYALGGLGSGFCDNEEELDVLVEKAFSFSPQVLVEKSLRDGKKWSMRWCATALTTVSPFVTWRTSTRWVSIRESPLLSLRLRRSVTPIIISCANLLSVSFAISVL